MEGSKGCETKLKEEEVVIFDLKVKIKQGKRIEYFLNTKLNDKIAKCLNLEEEIVTLRK